MSPIDFWILKFELFLYQAFRHHITALQNQRWIRLLQVMRSKSDHPQAAGKPIGIRRARRMARMKSAWKTGLGAVAMYDPLMVSLVMALMIRRLMSYS